MAQPHRRFWRLTLPIDRACLQKSHGSLRRTIVDAADGDRSTTDLVQPLLDGPNRYRGFHPGLEGVSGIIEGSVRCSGSSGWGSGASAWRHGGLLDEGRAGSDRPHWVRVRRSSVERVHYTALGVFGAGLIESVVWRSKSLRPETGRRFTGPETREMRKDSCSRRRGAALCGSALS